MNTLLSDIKLVGDELPWLKEYRAAGRREFARQGIPTAKTEAWKYTKPNRFLSTDFVFDPRGNNKFTVPAVNLPFAAHKLYFENGVLQDTFMKIPNGNILIDGESSDDIGELVLKDREMLSDNGIMIISATLNRKTKNIIGGPEILTRGFVYVKDSTELLEELKKMCKDIILNNINNNMVEYAKIKTSIREELGKYLSIQTGNRPMIISVITEV